MDDAARAWPDRLGEFRVTGILGEGAYGTVYAAERELAHASATSAPRRLALKVLRANLLADDGARKQFLHDAAIYASVDHPGVVKLFGFGILPDDRPFLAMERLEGETLAERLRRGTLPAQEAFGLFAQLGEALAALHGRHLLHRDVKPENIFLTYGVPYGAGERQAQAVLFDFGVVDGESDYTAPERVLGAQASVASEVFELAVTLYAMLCARLPWEEHGSVDERLHPRAPSAIGVPLPDELEAELMRALSSKVERRPTSVAQLAERVAQVARASGLASSVRPASEPVSEVPTIGELETSLRKKDSRKLAVLRADVAPAPAPAAVIDAPAAKTPHPRRRLVGAILGLVALAGGASLLVGRLARSSGAGADGARDAGAARAAEAPLPEGARHAAHTDRVPDEIWKHHPRDTAVLFALSWTQVLAAPPSRLVLGERAALPPTPRLAQAMRACAFDPVAELEWISVGVGVGGAGKNLDVMVAGRWTRDELEPCLVTLFSSPLAPAHLRREGRATLLEASGQARWLGWLDEHTLFFTTRPAIARPWIEARLDGRDAIDASSPLAQLGKRTDAGQSLWAVGYPFSATKTLAPGWPAPTQIVGGVRLFDEAHGEFRLSFADAKDAARALVSVEALLAEVSKSIPLGTSAVVADGRSDLIVRVDLDKPTTEAALRHGSEALTRWLDPR